MQLINILILFGLLHNVSYAQYWNDSYPIFEYTDSEIGCIDCLDELPKIDSWGMWADVGCTEESRTLYSDFDKECTAWEESHKGE